MPNIPQENSTAIEFKFSCPHTAEFYYVSEVGSKLLTLPSNDQLAAITILSERLRTGFSLEEVLDCLDPDAKISVGTSELVESIPHSYYCSIIGILAENLLSDSVNLPQE